MRRSVGVVLAGLILVLATASTASAGAYGAGNDDAQTALNIIPSGQWGGLPAPDGASTQAEMYDGLTPLFDNVSNGDLTTYFKSEHFGIDTSGPGTVAFRHELARLAIEETVEPRRRMALHRTALAALADPPAGEADAARLAHHAEAAGDGEAVLRYAR